MNSTLSAPMPANVMVNHTGTGLELAYRWYTSKFIFLAVFCLFWDGFLVFWYSMALGGEMEMMAILFPLLHVAVGLGLTYYTLAGFLNKTLVTVNPGEITIQHLPLPWFGNKVVQSTQLKQLYTEEIVRHGKNGTTITYRLNTVTHDEKKVKLVSGIDSKDTALFLEQGVEKYLGIKDVPVSGDVK
jgi:hypothetical protein